MNIKKQYVLLLISIALVMLPNVLLIIIGEDSVVDSTIKKLVYLVFTTSIILLPLVFFKPRIFVWISFVLCPLLFFEVFNINLFKAPSTIIAVASLYYTNYGEATELLSSYGRYIILLTITIAIHLYLLLKINSKFKLPKLLKRSILFGSALVLIGIFTRDIFIAKNTLQEVKSFKTLINKAQVFYTVKLEKTFPVGLYIKHKNARIGIELLSGYKERVKNFKFNAIREKNISEPEIYILVIGETARKHNFGLYNYHRNTTPNLDTISNLITFKNVKSSGNFTAITIPHILTRATPNNDSIKYLEPAILNTFKEAGFKTYWLRNQSIGIGGVFGFYTSLADQYKNLSVSFDVSDFDEELLPYIDEVLKENVLKKFIIIHTAGSHFRYNLRYPETFNKFKPSLRKGLSLDNNSIALKEKLVNSYDNSILYSDYILSTFIEKLNKQNVISSLYYISDHGENLYDDENEYLLHGFGIPTKYEIEVPLFIWNSDKYIKTFPSKDSILKSNVYKRISSINSFHTLLDIAAIKYPEEKLNRSFVNKTFDSLRTRYLLKTDKTVIKLD
jgi:glucan phosphoethanolaminetransferase (alkaline phosphatase superfamily)